MSHMSMIFVFGLALALLVATVAIAADLPKEPGKYAVIDTTMGTIIVKFYDKEAPKTVQNFIDLATGRKTGKPYFDGIIFHRVIPDFMIQGGDPTGTGRGGPGYTIPDEFGPGLKHSGPGILSMANAGPNTGGSQFFITVKATPWLDGRHAIFGKIVKGQDVADAISTTPRGPGDRPLKDVVMKTVRIYEVGADGAATELGK